MRFSKCKTIKEFINCFNDKKYRDDPNISNFDLDEYNDVFYLNMYPFKLSDKFDKNFYSKFINFSVKDFEMAQTLERNSEVNSIGDPEEQLDYGFANNDNILCFKHKNNIVIIRCFEYDGFDQFDFESHTEEYRRVFIKIEIPIEFFSILAKIK